MIPFIDLKPQHKAIQKQLKITFSRVLNDSFFILGKDVHDFELKFADCLQAKYCIGVGNGTDALQIALLSTGIQPGDEVLLPANTFIATALAVSHVGARPVLVDIDEKTFNLDPSQIVTHITKHTKAIIPVHLYGLPANLPQIIPIAKKFNLKVIEDCAQSHGAKIGPKMTGTFGDMACFSFYPAKNLGALGDGGAIVTNSKELFEQANLWHNYGETTKYHHQLLGYNSRLDTLQAALLNLKLPLLDKWNSQRQKIAKNYQKMLKNISQIELPYEPEDFTHVYHLFVIKAKNRDGLQTYLANSGIKTQIHYPIPIHLQAAYKHLNYQVGDFPIAEKLASEIISLPMFPGLTLKAQRQICNSISSFYET